MKKLMKKMVALAAALAMVLAMGITAFAAELPTATANDTTKTITITTPSGIASTEQVTYTVYKVFDATNDGTNTNVSYKLLENVTSAPTGFTVDDAGNVYLGTVSSTASDGAIAIKVNGATEYITLQTGDLTDDQVAAIAAYNSKVEVGTVVITGPSTSKTVVVPDYGYYYITTTTGSVVTVDTTNPTASVTDKNNVPTVDKKITGVSNSNTGSVANDKESATAKVGDVVTYTSTIIAKKGTEGLIYHDTLSAGLTLNADSLQIYGSTQGTGDGQYTTTKFENSDTVEDITITFNGKFAADTTITITYTATINDNAVVAGEGNKNSATIEYGNDSSHTFTSTPDEPKVYTYSFDLVKDNSDDEVLTGAEFTLKDASGALIYVVKDSDGNYKVASSSTVNGATTIIEAGKVTIAGLGNGTYTLTETKAPAGYNKLNDPVTITISDASNSATLTEDGKYSKGGLEVVNNKGAELPSTGGMGTTIFYVLGAILVIGAGVVLVTRRRTI